MKILDFVWWVLFVMCYVCFVTCKGLLSTSEEDGITGNSLLDIGRTYWCLY